MDFRGAREGYRAFEASQLPVRLSAVAMAFAMCCTLLCAPDASAAWDNPPRGRKPGVEHRTFPSASMRTAVGYNICLPPEYRSNPNQRFPVIYYLHGFKGDESSYLDYATHWRNGMRETGPCLLVFVNGGETSFFSDAPDGSVMGEAVVQELVSHVDAQFRTVAEPAKRSLHGYSMGGFGALKLTFKHPDLFGSAVAYGATLFSAEEMQKEAGKLYRTMFGNRARFEANNPIALAGENAARLRDHVSVALILGTKDEFLAQNRALAQVLKANGIRHELVELAGVKHDKDPIYEKGADRGFQFTGTKFKPSAGR